ncbi:MAG: glycosyltransferase, partial [Acidobacteria bacterium]|nr:glycosyltransferase [Acidobacteriota bacterium]
MSEADNLFIASSAYIKMGLDRLSKEFPEDAFTVITTEEFASKLSQFMLRFRRYRRAVFYTYDFEMSRTILWHGIVWWLARQGVLLDGSGRKRIASLITLIVRDTPQLLAEPLLLPYVFGRVARDLSVVESKPRSKMPERLSIAYLRTDHWFGTKAGGSVTHIAGVANSFRDLGVPLFFLSSDKLELIDESRTPLTCVRPSKYVQNIPDAPQIAYNLRMISAGNAVFRARRPTIVYQRYSQYNYSGAYLAAKWQIPFVLEYNGSELWMARHWGRPFRFRRWAERIETANLTAADAVIVVSDPMKSELVRRGFEPRKILVNPNGVDIERFDPEVVREKSQALREKLKLDEKMAVGFIGTFGKWHGADVLAYAIREVISQNPRVHFLFMGDGVTMPSVRQIVEQTGVSDHVTFTGMVPQEEGPVWLGACDILASPHVPNPDGSPFFGSPTKLFEYMAMARGIVASRLDQIAQVLRHEETGLLVTPGSAGELARAIVYLAANPAESDRLGRYARSLA